MIGQLAPAVQFNGVTKCYGNTRVIDQLTFSIPRGSTYGLLGPNGAGKSTSLKALMGLLRFDGQIKALGHDIEPLHGTPDAIRLKRRIGYVSEVHHVYRWMSVQQAMTFVKACQPHWNDDLARNMLELFQLAPRKRIHQLSKGMLAKLSLLLAVSHEPDLLILDEPTSGLDAMAREEFLYGVLQTIQDDERTIIFSSHSIGDVERLADRVGFMKQGRLIVDQSVDDLLTETKRIRATLKDGQRPVGLPEGTIWQQTSQREWELTVANWTTDLTDQLQRENCLESIEVSALSLEENFKDYFRDPMLARVHRPSGEEPCLAS